MKTGSFTTAPKVEGADGRISIARYAPRWAPAGFMSMRELAPGGWFRSVSKEKYRDLFMKEILGPLNPRAMFSRLQELVSKHGEVEPVLLCWEKPPFTESNWCHRRMVADWLEQHLSIEVPELEVAPKEKKPSTAKQTRGDTGSPIAQPTLFQQGVLEAAASAVTPPTAAPRPFGIGSTRRVK